MNQTKFLILVTLKKYEIKNITELSFGTKLSNSAEIYEEGTFHFTHL